VEVKSLLRAPRNRATATNLANNLACIHSAEYSICELKRVPKTKRAAMYVRMSTEHQQYSIVNQADAIERYAAEHKLTIVKKFIDSGKSGLTLQPLVEPQVFLEAHEEPSTLDGERTCSSVAPVVSSVCLPLGIVIVFSAITPFQVI